MEGLESMDPMLDFESQLHTSLRPVNPDGIFVDRLRSRLLTTPDTVVEIQTESEQRLNSVLLASAVIASSLVIGIVLVKLLFPHSDD